MASHTEEELEPRHDEIVPQHEEIMPQHEEPHKEPPDRVNVSASQGVELVHKIKVRIQSGWKVRALGKRWHLAIRKPCHAAVCKGVKKRKSEFDLRDNQDRGIAQDKTLVLILPSSSGFHSPSAIVSRHPDT